MEKDKQVKKLTEIIKEHLKGVLQIEIDILAEALYQKGCRIIPEGAVVVSKQVWEEHIENWDKTTKAVEERVRKETAEKFAEKVIKRLINITDIRQIVDKIAKEITEGNNG